MNKGIYRLITNRKFVKKLSEVFENKLKTKTGWGKNEVLIAYKDSVNESLLEIIDDNTAPIVATSNNGIIMSEPDEYGSVTVFINDIVTEHTKLDLDGIKNLRNNLNIILEKYGKMAE